LCFVPEDQRNAIVSIAKKVLGKVKLRAYEPMRAGHFVETVDDCFEAARVFDLTEFPERRPKRRDVVNGPLVKIVKGTEFSSLLLVDEADEARHVRVFDPFVRWFPERLFHVISDG
jgi:hypothetical protein